MVSLLSPLLFYSQFSASRTIHLKHNSIMSLLVLKSCSSSCDIVIYNKNVFGLSSIPGIDLLKHLEFGKNESYKGVFYYVNEVIFGLHSRKELVAREANQVIRILDLSVSPPDLWGRRKGWRGIQSPMGICYS